MVRQGGDGPLRSHRWWDAGARFGARLPEAFLIDDLGPASPQHGAPWFYRTAMKKAGFAIDLRLIENEFPG